MAWLRRGRWRPGRQRLFLPWCLAAGVCLYLMAAYPAKEVVPFHLIWLAFALAYGLEAWPLGRTLFALAAVTVASTVVMVGRAADGRIDALETTELPLMAVIALLVVWHVRRREASMAELEAVSQREIRAAEQRERMRRLTSHEMRTSLTIASGYLDMTLGEEAVEEAREDLMVVRDELQRLGRALDRMLRLIRLQDSETRTPVDLDGLLRRTMERWSGVTSREWQVEATAGSVDGYAEGIRDAVDTLVENAVRYTSERDTVRLVGRRVGQAVLVGVADSGRGLADDHSALVNSRLRLGAPQAEQWDEQAQTGLGFGIVEDVAHQHGGRVVAGRSREGGALIAMVLRTSAR